MSKDFAALYSDEGRPPIPPEQLLSALLLQAFYGLRPERQLMEQLDYNLLFRWFVGLSPQYGDVFQRSCRPWLDSSTREAAAVGRTLLGRWHAD